MTQVVAEVASGFDCIVGVEIRDGIQSFALNIERGIKKEKKRNINSMYHGSAVRLKRQNLINPLIHNAVLHHILALKVKISVFSVSKDFKRKIKKKNKYSLC